MPPSLENRSVLVTGAGGFIGSHLVEGLLRAGAKVTALVRYNARSQIGNLDFVDPALTSGLTIRFGNVEDPDFVRRLVEGQDIVMHLAALIGIPYSYVSPRSYVATNITGTLNILEAAREMGVARVINTSTSEVYGTPATTPIGEGHPLQGQSPYSASKIAADKLAEAYHRSFETPVVTLRPFNTFGPRQSARAFIPAIISQALAGDTVRLGALTPRRDLTYVGDTVDAYLKAAVAPGLEGETIQLGVGEAHSVGEIADRILSLMGLQRRIERDPVRDRPQASEVMTLISDNSLARRRLGWAPTTSLDEGLRRSIRFIADHRDLYPASAYLV